MPSHIESSHQGRQQMHYIYNTACSVTWLMYCPSNFNEIILFPLSEYDGPDTSVHGGDAGVAK